MVGVALLYFLLAISLIFNKQMIMHGQPIFSQGIRLMFSGSIFLFINYIIGKKKSPIGYKYIWLFAQLSLFLFCIAYSLNIITMNKFSTAQFSFLLNLSPFLSALLSYFYLSEKLNRNKCIGLFIGFLGFIPLLFMKSNMHNNMTLLSFFGLLAFGSILSYTYGLLVLRKINELKKYSSFFITGIAMFCAGFFTLILSFSLESWKTHLIVDSKSFFLYLTSIILIGDILVFSLYNKLLRQYTVTFITFAGFLYPLFSALLGWAFLHEPLTWHFFVASIIVFIGLYIFYKEEI